MLKTITSLVAVNGAFFLLTNYPTYLRDPWIAQNYAQNCHRVSPKHSAIFLYKVVDKAQFIFSDNMGIAASRLVENCPHFPLEEVEAAVDRLSKKYFINWGKEDLISAYQKIIDKHLHHQDLCIEQWEKECWIHCEKARHTAGKIAKIAAMKDSDRKEAVYTLTKGCQIRQARKPGMCPPLSLPFSI